MYLVYNIHSTQYLYVDIHCEIHWEPDVQQLISAAVIITTTVSKWIINND